MGGAAEKDSAMRRQEENGEVQPPYTQRGAVGLQSNIDPQRDEPYMCIIHPFLTTPSWKSSPNLTPQEVKRAEYDDRGQSKVKESRYLRTSRWRAGYTKVSKHRLQAKSGPNLARVARENDAFFSRESTLDSTGPGILGVEASEKGSVARYGRLGCFELLGFGGVLRLVLQREFESKGLNIRRPRSKTNRVLQGFGARRQTNWAGELTMVKIQPGKRWEAESNGSKAGR
ncbi:hypothetical protein B0H16DRAFT_1479661 [Mycena metata]|uniref:Uncharacterized protein n=1 Tax=Mycena metata TaxID=1033252 RepID=A0AAD7MDG6_9AGAR|nr:hypothetical protein B0H16DRAFT_1479661 [Mycena metata]